MAATRFILSGGLMLGAAFMCGCPVQDPGGGDDTVARPLYGLNFSPYGPGQDPASGIELSQAQVRDRLSRVVGYTEWIKSFGCTHGLQHIGPAVHEHGGQAAIGAWLGTDAVANEAELASLIQLAQAGHVDLAVVGSEVLRRGDLTEAQLIAHINRVRAEAPGVPVTTSDTYGAILAHPAVVEACDLILITVYPYWEGIPLADAVNTVADRYQQTVATAGGKTVIISETGWPSAGNTVGSAVPSPESAAAYFQAFVAWARGAGVPFFWFAAYDEAWKVRDEGPQGAHWGIWDETGVMKPGMDSVFVD